MRLCVALYGYFYFCCSNNFVHHTHIQDMICFSFLFHACVYSYIWQRLSSWFSMVLTGNRMHVNNEPWNRPNIQSQTQIHVPRKPGQYQV